MNALMLYAKEAAAEDLSDIVARARALGFDALFPVCKSYDGSAFFRSSRATVRMDALSRVCEEAAKHDMRTYAWFCLFTEGYRGTLEKDGRSLFLQSHPETAAVRRNGQSTLEDPVACDGGLENYVCPARDSVQEHQIMMMLELAERYPLRGIHLDFLRFPMPGDFCYCSVCRKRFNQKFGADIYGASAPLRAEYRSQVLGQFVNRANEALSRSRPGTELSALVWAYPESLAIGQDWRDWKLSFATPMFYHRAYGRSVSWVRAQIIQHKKLASVRIIPALAGSRSEFCTHGELSRLRAVGTREAGAYLVTHYGVRQLLRNLENSSGLDQMRRVLAGCGQELRTVGIRAVRALREEIVKWKF